MMKKRILSVILALSLCVTACPAVFAAMENFTPQRTYNNTFIDVPNTAWYAPYVTKTYELGLVNGTSQTQFSPQSNITYAQTIALAARIHAQYHGNEIPTVSGAWYAPYVAYAVEYRIIGSDFLSEAMLDDLVINRLNFAWIMFFALPEEEYTAQNTIGEDQIPDLPLSTEGANMVYAMYETGILTGNNAYGTFTPDAAITRAEVATIISRMVDPSLRKTFSLAELPQLIEVTNTLHISTVEAMEQRIYQENTFANSSAMQNQILTRSNWRSYEKALLDTIVDRMDYDGLKTIGKSIGRDGQTGVNRYQIAASEMGQWMAFYYGIDPSATQPRDGIYQNSIYTAYGSQGFIGDNINITHIYDLENFNFYIQYDRTWEADPATYSGSGYAILHWTGDHYQVYELGWSAPSASLTNLAAYKN